ncbi:unnamed protein product [Urochloa decumbens]|uniref:Uncharacterized protein n=1 Tax=Urochloa decumbens TaxID=240449 RepID=A0ABC9CM21_9POAL
MERISCHADLRALQDRFDRRMLLKLVSLESVSIASDSYALLRNLVERRNWRCSEMDMDFLSLMASVAAVLHKIKLALSPLLDQEAKPGEGFPKDLLLLKNSALALLSLWEDANEIVKKCVGSLVEQDVFLGNAENVGGVVEDFVNQVLKGTRNFAWLQERVPPLLNEVDVLLSTPVCFPYSE